jgi:hypothetical protein
MLDETIQAFLFTGEEPERDTSAAALYASRLFHKGNIEAAWMRDRAGLLRSWLREHPCTRPWAWWEFDAPREQVDGSPFKECPQRRRLGGIGTPTHEVLGVWSYFVKGIPKDWVCAFFVEYYNGRAHDIHGNIIPTEFKEGNFKGVVIDPDNPPTFESETAYLDRYGLLDEEETAYLKRHRSLLRPETVHE